MRTEKRLNVDWSVRQLNERPASFGEGYHSYHHSFPWDYKAAELGSGFHSIKIFIDIMASIVQAYNLRFASEEINQGGEVRKGIMTRDGITKCDAKKAVVMFG